MIKFLSMFLKLTDLQRIPGEIVSVKGGEKLNFTTSAGLLKNAFSGGVWGISSFQWTCMHKQR